MLSKCNDIRLIAIDLDGTLLASDNSVPKANIKAIKNAKDAGIQVVICTGRPFRSMSYLLDQLNFTDENDLVCTYNGGLIQYAKSGEILHQETLTKKDALILKNVADRLHLPINMIDLHTIYEPPYPVNAPSIYQLNRRRTTNDGGLEFHAVTLESMPENWSFNKMVIARPANELDQAISNFPSELYSDYNIFKTQPNFLEIVPKNVNKGYAISYLRTHLKLHKSQVMSIGDHENDLSLIQAAGFGVAMENAIDEVKESAQFITKSNDQAGVAYAIDYVLSAMNNNRGD